MRKHLVISVVLSGLFMAGAFAATNNPGSFTDFTVPVAAGNQSLTLEVLNDGAIGSYVLVKFGAPFQNNQDFQYASMIEGQTNRIGLERPELQTGNCFVRVLTPASATGPHSFTLTSTLDGTVRSSAFPAEKLQVFSATGSVNAGGDHYFRFRAPTNFNGGRIVLSTNNASTIYLQNENANGGHIASSSSSTLHTLLLSPALLTPGSAYCIRIHADSSITYNIDTENVYLRTLTWDPGTAPAGSAPVAQPNALGGDYLFQITTQTSLSGAWRQALKVNSGEADLYMSTSIPSTANYSYKSDRAGSDGLILDDSQFQNNQIWYLLVHGTRNATWSIFSGDIYVHDLGQLAAFDSSASSSASLPAQFRIAPNSHEVPIGLEGAVYFKTSVPGTTKAWRLWLEGKSNDIFVQKNTAPVAPGNYELTEAGQMLAVPAYLVNATYFIGIPGNPGSSVALDSRQQQIRDPGADDFSFTLNGADDGGYGYVTYQIEVPINQIAWQTKCTPTAGNADLYIRRGNIPNRQHNDGYSEAQSPVIDSVTLVPPSLTNGTWYVTVYGNTSFNFTLSSGNPVITPIAFINDDATPANPPKSSGAHITNNAPAQSGWRYYQINNIESQLGTLGWELFLASQAPGTEIALRRNAVPGRWNYRDTNYSYTSSHVDFTSNHGFLQRPGHQADIWYIGIYIPDQALGAFELTTREIGSPDLALNGGNVQVTNSAPELWKYFRVTIPSGASTPLGWDLRLQNVTSGLPEMVVRRDLLPETTGSTSFFPYFYNQWPLGAQWQAPVDWSNRYYAADGSIELSRVLAAGIGSPLEPGTYYVGIKNSTASGPMTYSVRSRGIGIGNDSGGNPWQIQVQTLAFSGAGSSASFSGLVPREAKYYKVTVPANTKSWNVSLTPTVGECLLGVRRGALPNSELATNNSEVFDGARRQIDGPEYFYKYPTQAQGDFIPAGDYYLVVESEGATPSDIYHIGANPSSYTVSSNGEVAIDDRTAQSLTTTSPITWTNQTVVFGSQRIYRFHVPPSIESMEVRLNNASGGPGMALHGDPTGAPHIPASYALYNQYRADEGGYNYDKGHQSLIISAQPFEGDYTIVVRADSPNGSDRPDAHFDIEVTVKQASLLAFNGGTATISLQAPDTFEYFKVTVPAGALGWDLRIKNVTSGAPELLVRRDLLPSDYGSTSGFPYFYGSWPSGFQWQAYQDWTGRTYTADAGAVTDPTRIMAMGMNNPLEPGTYYIGVRNVGASAPMSYTIQSRGIGIGNDGGTPWAIQVQPLSFTGAGNMITTSNVAPREAAYYRVDVPAGAQSWSMQALPALGECMMALHFGSLPNVTTGYGTENDLGYHGGAYRSKEGAEYFYKYPAPPNSTITSGSYYIAVVGEGQAPADAYHIGTGPSNFTVTSHGEAQINDKTNEQLSGNHPIQWFGESLLFGQQKIYRFRVPAGVESMEVRLLNRQGGPAMALRGDAQGSGRISSSYSPWSYYRAEEGGYNIDGYDDSLLTPAQPEPGDYTLVVRADSSTGSDRPDASYDIQVTIRQTIPLNFNGDSFTMSNQEPDTWQYFRVTVPPDALGWDLRLTDVTSGIPELVVCRDQLPDQITTTGFFPNYYDRWVSGFVWSAGQDWTGRYYTADTGSVNEPGRILAMGMDNPLSPGTYFIGVKNYYASSPMSYTLLTRGIGINNDSDNKPWELQVRDLQFSGAGNTVSGTSLAPREAAYYRVTVPSNAKSWSLQLTPTAGEAMLAMRFNALPNVAVSFYNGTDDIGYFGGTKRQKSGQEWFYKYPISPNTTITPGVYYIAVVGEGVSPADDYHVGPGSSNFTLTSNGEVAIDDKTSVVLSPANPVTWTGQSLAYGQQKQYRFRIPPGVISAEIQMPNAVGGPAMSLRSAPVGLGHIPTSYTPFGYYRADEGGFDATYYNFQLITVPEPAPGDYTLTIRADSTDGADRPAAQFDVQVSALTVGNLNLDAVQNAGGGTHVAANRHLANQQVHYYKIVVPQSMTLPNGEPIAGWKLDVAESIGDVIIRVRRGAIPNQEGIGVLNRNELHTAIVAPYLEPGDWFVEVYGNGISDYTLSSSIVRPQAAWTMPAVEGNTFGDSGELDLGGNDFHFFKITVPNGNKGLFHTKLEAVNGDPDLYIRETGVPTRSHGDPTVYWYSGSIYDRYQTGTGTAYGNWVPLDGRVEAQLRPGDWWVMVFASGSSNVRYRLVATTGDVQNMNRDSGGFTNQTLAAGDMRYYKVTDATPDNNWNLTFTETFGDGVMFIRDTIPPGFGYYLSGGYGASIDWYNDNMILQPNPYLSYDDSGTYQFGIPPIKPGATYYVGIYAKNDLTFNISSTTSGGQFAATNIPFYAGNAAATLNPGEARIYRIDTPPEAFHWHHETTHDVTVIFRISPGTVPPEDGFAAFSSYTADHTFDYPLIAGTFPWQPNRTYYMLVRNTDSVPHPFTFQMAGVPPAIVSFTPADNATNVSINTDFTIRFDRPVNPGSGAINIFQAASGYYEASFFVGFADITFAGDTVTIHSASNLTPRTDYYVEFAGTCFLGEFNARCRGISDPTTWNFHTTDNAPVPVLNSISPETAGYGGPDFDLIVYGTSFVSNTVVRWEGKPDLIPTFQTSTHMTVRVPAAYIAAKATVNVSVFTPAPGGGASSALPLAIVNPQPFISNFGPTTASAGGPSFTLTISGGGFIPESVIRWENEPDLVPATFSPTQLTALIPASYIANGGYKYISVFNPGPGGGATGTPYVTVHNPEPNLISINPMTVVAGDSAFTLTLNGLHFVADTKVYAFDNELPVLTRTSSQLTVTVPESMIASSGEIPFSVFNPEPHGGSSSIQHLHIVNAVPILTEAVPPFVVVGSTNVHLTLLGQKFANGAIVKWSGRPDLLNPSVTPAQIDIDVPDSYFTETGDYMLTVVNPAPGGGPSEAITFSVQNPAPTLASIDPASIVAGSGTFVLTLNGTNFISSSLVNWEGQADLTPSSIDPNVITVSVPASYVAVGGTPNITVSNPAPGGGPSEAKPFTIVNLTPTISNISPSSANAGGAGFMMTIDGTNFLSASTIRWQGQNELTPLSVTPAQITVDIPASYIANGGSPSVTVYNPAPGGGDSNPKTFSINNPLPSLTSLNPTSIIAGGADFTLTLTGNDFVASSKVKWPGQADLSPLIQSATQITVQVPAAYIAAAGTASITVFNPSPGGGSSGAQTITLNNPAPTLASINPNSATVGSPNFTLTLTGTNFISSSVVKWQGQADLTPATVSATQITVTVPASYVTNAGTADVTVFNGAPGGGTTAPQTFTITSTNPVPSLTDINPASSIAGDAGFTLTLNGSNFVSASIVRWQGKADLTPLTTSQTQLTVDVPASYLAAAGTAQVTVFNPAPGGGTSAPQTFTINNPLPVLDTINPTSVNAGGPSFTLTLSGSDFVSTSVVKWQGQIDLTPATVNATQITVNVPASYIADGGTPSITVFSPLPGGGTSFLQTLTINNPVPVLTSINPASAILDSPGFVMTLTGSNFVPGTRVHFGGEDDLTPVTVTATQITVNVPASYLTSIYQAAITAFNVTPGGGISETQVFEVVNPAPTLSSINPTSATLDGAGFTMTLTGTNFVSTSVVEWENQNGLTPDSVTSTQITVSVPAHYLTTVGTYAITVRTGIPGGGTTAPQSFTVESPLPSLSGMTPMSAILNSGPFILTLDGGNFYSGSVVKWQGQADLVPTTFTSTQLTVSVPGSYLAASGTFNVAVFNTAPGGGTSGAQTFTVNNPAPTLTSISPNTAVVGDAAFTLTLDGSDFVAASVVKWHGRADLNPATFTSSSITVNVPASYLSAAGTPGITVFSPAPGGGTSGPQTFTITAPTQAPVINSPLTATAEKGQSFSYTITATNNPTSYDAIGLPSGLSISGPVISGAPTISGAVAIVISATNSAGTDTRTLILTINNSTQTNHPPTFVSPPAANPNFTTTGISVLFTAICSDSDGDALTVVWDFGDSSFDIGAAVTHQYTSAGIYNVKVLVSDGQDELNGSVLVVVNEGTVGGGEFAVQKAAIKFNFPKPTSDSLVFLGTVPVEVGGSPAGLIVETEVGSLESKFTLDAKAKATSDDKTTTLKVTVKLAKNGTFSVSPAKFQYSVKKKPLFALLEEVGFTNETISPPEEIDVPMVMSFGDDNFLDIFTVKYTAKQGKSGSAKK